jgi:hypothetical protein
MSSSLVLLTCIAAVASVALFLLLSQTRRRTSELLAFALGIPAYALLISFDRWAPAWNLLVRFPRNGSELTANPASLITLLVADGAVPRGSVLVDLTRDGTLSAEPAKNAQISRFRLTYEQPGGSLTTTLRLFIKYQAERGTSLFARALAAAYSPVHTEVGFYTRIVPALKAFPGAPRIPTPRCLAARYSRAFGRVLTVLELLRDDEYEATPDWKVGGAGSNALTSELPRSPSPSLRCAQGASPDQIRAMLRAVVPLHASFWGSSRAGVPGSPSEFLGQQLGVSWLDGLVRLFLSPSTDPPWFKPIWDGVGRWLAPLPVCVSHGDFRPGNMLFHRTTGAVVLTDWEALAVTPFLWDFTYATVLGMAPAARRAAHGELLAEYLSSLRAALQAAGHTEEADNLPPLATCESAVTALCISIFYFGFVLAKMGGIGTPQGNTDADCTAWQERGSAVLERTATPLQIADTAAALGVDEDVVRQMRAYLELQQKQQPVH